MNFVHEGFWGPISNVFGLGLGPQPLPQREPVNPKFIEKLKIIEEKCRRKICNSRMEFYFGCSTCRICKKENGSSEYYYNGFCWPEGYIHYLIDHSVHPSKSFYNMVISS